MVEHAYTYMHNSYVTCVCLCVRGDPNYDADSSIVYFNTYDPNDHNRKSTGISMKCVNGRLWNGFI